MSFPKALQRLTKNKLQISIRESGDVTILDVRGRATIGDGRYLLSAHLRRLVTKGARKLLLNLADVRQLDSSGISPVIGAHLSLSRQGGSLKLVCPRGRVQDVLRVMRVADFIPTFEDENSSAGQFPTTGICRLGPHGTLFAFFAAPVPPENLELFERRGLRHFKISGNHRSYLNTSRRNSTVVCHDLASVCG